MGGNNEFFEDFERNKYLKKLPSVQRVNQSKCLYNWVLEYFIRNDTVGVTWLMFVLTIFTSPPVHQTTAKVVLDSQKAW